MTPLIEAQLEAFFRAHPPPGAVADVGCGNDERAFYALQRAGGLVGTQGFTGYDLPFDICATALPKVFATVISCDLLEHVLDPFNAARNIVRSIGWGGWLYVTTVFAFEHHEYPIDMWRFTTTALEHLFSRQPPWVVEVERCWYEQETPIEGFGNRWRVSLIGRRPA